MARRGDRLASESEEMYHLDVLSFESTEGKI